MAPSDHFTDGNSVGVIIKIPNPCRRDSSLLCRRGKNLCDGHKHFESCAFGHFSRVLDSPCSIAPWMVESATP